jgi:hypothetical protein
LFRGQIGVLLAKDIVDEVRGLIEIREQIEVISSFPFNTNMSPARARFANLLKKVGISRKYGHGVEEVLRSEIADELQGSNGD